MLLKIVSDFSIYKNNLVASTYQKTLKIYEAATLKQSIDLPVSLTKICQFKEFLLGVSYSNGILYILDSNYSIVGTIPDIAKPTLLSTNGDIVVVATHNSELFVFKEVDGALCNICTKKMNKVPTALFVGADHVCIGIENTLLIFDEKLNKMEKLNEIIFTKDYSNCISSISMNEFQVVVGLISGRIHFEELSIPDESFAFNSHAQHPVSQVCLGKTLISAGFDGKVLEWDILNKRQMNILLETDKFIRKVVLNGNILYYIAEDDPEAGSGNEFAYKYINEC